MFLSLNVSSAAPPLTPLSSNRLIPTASAYLHSVSTPCSPSLSPAPFVVSPQTFSLRWCQDRCRSFCIMFTRGLNVFLNCCDLTRLNMALSRRRIFPKIQWDKIKYLYERRWIEDTVEIYNGRNKYWQKYSFINFLWNIENLYYTMCVIYYRHSGFLEV